MRWWRSAALCALSATPALRAQQTGARAPDTDLPSLLAPVPNVPGLRARLQGLNAAATVTSVHDSSSGWYTLVTPAISFAASRHYSFDANMAVYLYRLAAEEVTTTTQQPPSAPGQPQPGPQQTISTTTLQPHKGELGDLVLAGHASFARGALAYSLTPSMTVPTGNVDHGLSTGRVTFDIDNHFELSRPRIAALLDVGGGDSSTLFNRLVTKDYTSLGPLAHFAVGARVLLPMHAVFQSVAYEQLPLGDSKIYTTLSRPGYPDRTVVSGRSVSEDNGFTTSVVAPLSSRLTFQTYYNRSLRLKLDTVSVGLTVSLRSSGLRKRRATNTLDSLLR